jgi:hypothetical protein
MRIAAVLGFGVLGFLIAPQAQALTVANFDPKPHTVTVKAGSDSTKLTIEPDTAVEPACAGGCTIELENGELYDLKGGEQASIEGGVLFVDAAGEAPPEAGGQAQ